MQIQDTGNRPSPTAPDHRVSALKDRWSVLWSCCAILGLCLVVGLPTIRPDNYFLGDDFGLVHHLHKLPLYRFLSYFASDWTEGIYGFTLDELRPFLAFTYWLDSRLFGAANAQGYHATNVVLHMLNGLLVLAIARSVAPGQKAVAASGGLDIRAHAKPRRTDIVDQRPGRFSCGAVLLGRVLMFRPVSSPTTPRMVRCYARHLHLWSVCETVTSYLSSTHPGL